METCVLIPTELSLVLTAGPATLNGGRLNEMGVRVWSNQRIPRGSKFYPLQGTVRLDKLEVYSKLDPTDIRHRFGCYDEISVEEPQGSRHCNWIRFLRAVPTLTAEVNLLGSKVDGQVVFETTRSISPHTELVAYCIDDVSANYEDVTVQVALRIANFHFRQAMGILLDESPLDLSTTLVSSRILITSASDLEETKNFTDPSYPYSISLPQRRVPRERTLLPCEVCGKTFDRPSLLKRHMLTHTGEKPHSCDICGKGFSTSSSLNTHRRIHSGEKPHQCTVCGKRFTASSNLYYHRMTHIKDKPHKCTLCSKSFSTPGDLKNHMYIHSGSWPLKCHICNRGFSRQTNLKNHLFLHSELTNGDDCIVCGQSLSATSPSLLHGCCEGCYKKQIASRLSSSKDNHNINNQTDSKRIPTTFRLDSEQDGGSSSSEMAFDFPDTPSMSSPSKTSTSSDDVLFTSTTNDVHRISNT